ncbi:alpha/beta fold hydrolase [Zhongshania aliphaticivorans]|uniref:alpha/beta fold hydrolase n=1 Tax=Zhongshania aliphaticivorans TaxID=1470434 RepID=UPI0039C9B2D1
MLAACATPTQRIDVTAERLGMTKGLVEGLNFRHVTYAKPHSTTKTLHIYLDGDGSPWRHGRYIANDPTPRNPLVLGLASLDTEADVVYLGRPCYLGLHDEPMCNKNLWTSARYGDAVVRSMAAAAQALIQERGANSVSLIGFSGGGSLAMLMLAYMVSVDEVVTVAANLDTDGWAKHHGYLPLHESLNPMLLRYPTHVRYRHFSGEHDDNVPTQLTRAFIARHGGELVLVPNFSHHCCWREQWPDLIKK